MLRYIYASNLDDHPVLADMMFKDRSRDSDPRLRPSGIGGSQAGQLRSQTFPDRSQRRQKRLNHQVNRSFAHRGTGP